MKRRKEILMNVPRDDEETPKMPVQNDINRLLLTAMNFRHTTSGTKTEIKKPRLEEANPNTPQSTASISPPPFLPMTPLNPKINKQHKNLQQCESNPDTPETLNSISPPPYSPLTPLILLKRKREQQIEKEELSESNLSQPVSPQIQNEEPASSPLPLMSPETKELFDVLNHSYEDINSDVIEDIEDLNFGNGSDDSVNDPDFIVNKAEDENDSDTESNDSVYERETEHECDKTQENSQNVVIKSTSPPRNQKEYNIEITSDNNSIDEREIEEGLRLSITECKNADTNNLALPGKDNLTQLQTTKKSIENNTDSDDLHLPEKETQSFTAKYNVDETTEDHNTSDSEIRKVSRLPTVRNKENTIEGNNSEPPAKQKQTLLFTSDNNYKDIFENNNTYFLPDTEETQLLANKTDITDTTDKENTAIARKEKQTQLLTTKNNIQDNTDTDGILPEKDTQLLATETDILDYTDNESLASPSLLTSYDNPDLEILNKAEGDDDSVTEKNDSLHDSDQNNVERETEHEYDETQEKSQNVVIKSTSPPKNEKGYNIENNSDNNSRDELEIEEGLQLSITECKNADTNNLALPGKENLTQLQTTKKSIENNTDSDDLHLPEKETQSFTAKYNVDETTEDHNTSDSEIRKVSRLPTVRNKENTIEGNNSEPPAKQKQTLLFTSDNNYKDIFENNNTYFLPDTEETQLLANKTDITDTTDKENTAIARKEKQTQLLTTKNNIQDNTDTDGILPEKDTQLLATETDILDYTENESLASPSLLTSNNIVGNNSILRTPEQQTEDQIENAEMTGRPKKGRKRKYGLTNAERKERKYNNLEYTTKKNKKIEPKTFIDHKCTCSKKCDTLVSAEERKQAFEKYVHLGSYNAQLAFIASLVKENRKKRNCTMVDIPPERKKPKQFVRTYTLSGVEVCREMFLRTLQITTQKITITLKKMRNNEVLNDKRGKSVAGWNKISEEDFNFIVLLISKLPQYESHYRREKNSDARYLEPGMTVPKIYEQYQKEFIEKFGKDRACVSLSKFKDIFMSKFNLRCKSLKKDTCNKCDSYAVKIQNANSSEEKATAENEKSMHLEKATKLRDQMNEDFEKALTSDTTECLTFDLEKTLPLPRIPTNIAFYKRQLWLYNSGIHSASDDVGHCYIWVEGEAGRGAQEVGSCLIKYLEHKLRPTVEHLILWSDCCGGQNRNIKVVLMLKAYLNEHPKLKTISFRYLESGHTFLPNDTDFSKIEVALKHHQRLYTPEDYIAVIKTAKKQKPLQVYKMQKTDFYSVENIEKNIINRKKFTDKSKVNWLQTKEILIKKDELYSVFMRTSMNEEFKELRVEKKIKGELRPIDKADMQLLWPNGKPIAPAKLADLESMYHLIPNDCLLFYKQLKASDQIIDDIDGYGGQPDFEVEDMED